MTTPPDYTQRDFPHRNINNPRGRDFRHLLDEEEFVFAPELHHALDARLAEIIGH